MEQLNTNSFWSSRVKIIPHKFHFPILPPQADFNINLTIYQYNTTVQQVTAHSVRNKTQYYQSSALAPQPKMKCVASPKHTVSKYHPGHMIPHMGNLSTLSSLTFKVKHYKIKNTQD